MNGSVFARDFDNIIPGAWNGKHIAVIAINAHNRGHRLTAHRLNPRFNGTFLYKKNASNGLTLFKVI